MRSKSTTPPAANNPEIRAIKRICRAESLYITLLPSLKYGYWLRARIAEIRCAQNGCRCEVIVPTQDSLRRVSVSWLNEDRQKSVGKVFDVAQHDQRSLPAEGYATGCSVNQHQDSINSEYGS